MGETAVGIPSDPSSVGSVINTAVTSAKSFETLGITGVLFLLVLALGCMLVFKLKNDSKLANLATQLANLTAATNSSTELHKEINSSNMKLIEHHLESLKQSMDKLEGYILNMRGNGSR